MNSLSLILFASLFLALNGLPKSRWTRGASDNDDVEVLRSFPKTSFNELQLRRYCRGFQEHYSKFCDGKVPSKKDISSKIANFCKDYSKYCPQSSEESGFVLATPPPLPEEDSSEELVVPPRLPGSRLNPTMDSPVAFDLPLSESHRHSEKPRMEMTAEIIKTCTADCTLPHCTTECKCAHSHPVVHMMCNPPPTGDLVATCNKWYAKCPMFQPVSY